MRRHQHMFLRIDPELARRNHHRPLPSSSHFLNQCSRVHRVAAWLIINNQLTIMNDCFLNDYQDFNCF